MNTMATTPAAMLTEKELFSQFLKMRVSRLTSFGALLSYYTPESLLRSTGEYGDVLVELGERLMDWLEPDEDPAEGLRQIIEDLEFYIEGLRLIHEDFEAMKTIKLVLPEEPQDADDEAAAAWEAAYQQAEENPRYRPAVEDA